MTELRAEMSATVFRVHTAPGERVGADDPVVTLESMKMEIPVVAGVAGIVSTLGVTEGCPRGGGRAARDHRAGGRRNLKSRSTSNFCPETLARGDGRHLPWSRAA